MTVIVYADIISQEYVLDTGLSGGWSSYTQAGTATNDKESFNGALLELHGKFRRLALNYYAYVFSTYGVFTASLKPVRVERAR